MAYSVTEVLQMLGSNLITKPEARHLLNLKDELIKENK